MFWLVSDVVILLDYTEWITASIEPNFWRGYYFWQSALQNIVNTVDMEVPGTTYSFIFFSNIMNDYTTAQYWKGSGTDLFDRYLTFNSELYKFAVGSFMLTQASYSGFNAALETYASIYPPGTTLILMAGPSFSESSPGEREKAVKYLQTLYAQRSLTFAQVRFSDSAVDESNTFSQVTGGNPSLSSQQHSWVPGASQTKLVQDVSALILKALGISPNH